MFKIIILFLFLHWSSFSLGQHFEGQVVYTVFERFDDPNEVVPEDSIVVSIAESMVLHEAYIGGKVSYWTLLRNDTLFESKSDDFAVYTIVNKAAKTYQLTVGEGKQSRTNREGVILENNSGNIYFALYDSTLLVDFCIYPIFANNLPYLPRYFHLNNEDASYTRQIATVRTKKLNSSLFEINKKHQILSETAYQKEWIKNLKPESFMGDDNILYEAID